MVTPGSPLRRFWSLDPQLIFLNHGALGACPTAVIQKQEQLRTLMEANPVQFLFRDLESRLDEIRARLGEFVGSQPERLVFVPNATAGVNAILRSLQFAPGDEILTTDHLYNACSNAARYVAERVQARVVVVQVPFPVTCSEHVLDLILSAAGPRVRLALLDHVTSPTALMWPISDLVTELSARGIDTLVDGAHAPGMMPLNLDALGAAYYVGDCHKWLCAPKGAGFLYVRPDRQDRVVPTTISHGANSPRTDRSRYRLLFDWTGTSDPTAALSVPAALAQVASLLPGGWSEAMATNRKLALYGRDVLCSALGLDAPAPNEMLGSMAALVLPPPTHITSNDALDPLQESLWREERIEVAIYPWGNPPRRILRVSAQLYNTPEEMEHLAYAIRERVQA